MPHGLKAWQHPHGGKVAHLILSIPAQIFATKLVGSVVPEATLTSQDAAEQVQHEPDGRQDDEQGQQDCNGFVWLHGYSLLLHPAYHKQGSIV